MFRRLVIALAGAMIFLGLGQAAYAATDAPSAATTAPAATSQAHHVVVVGIPGLMWSDVSASGTPNLWRLAEQGSVGSLSVRGLGTTTCPLDGWLAVSAGARAGYNGLHCGAFPAAPVRSGGHWALAGEQELRAWNEHSDFRAPVGSLGDAVESAGKCVTAVGPGAAVGAADTNGVIAQYAASPGAMTAAQWGTCAVDLVDIESVEAPYLRGGTYPELTATPAQRAAGARAADAELGTVMAHIPAGSTILIAGLSDDVTRPHLRVAIADGPSPAGSGAATYAHGTLRSDSTRRDGMVINPDVTATVFSAVGAKVPANVDGTPWINSGSRAGSLSGVIHGFVGTDVAAQVIARVDVHFYLGLVIAQLAFYILAGLVLWFGGRSDVGGGTGRRRSRLLTLTRVVALAAASVPVSTYLVNLIPWWNASSPTPTLFAGVAGIDVVLVAIAALGPWRRDVLGSGTVIAVITVLVLATDLLRGSPLQLNSLTGYSPLVGGRYYGLANIAFAVFATGTLMAATGIAHLLVSRGRSLRSAVTAVLAVCLVAEFFCGDPALGAKFGGTIALVPGIAVTVMIVGRKRVTWWKLGVFAVLGVVVIGAACFLDYLRPPDQRTHLGRFFATLLNGQAEPVVMRKFDAMVHTVGNIPLALLAAGGLAFLFFVLIRPGRLRASALEMTYERAPLLRAGLTGTLATALIGFAVEDSGIAVPSLALTVAVPLALAACLWTLREGGTPVPMDVDAPPEPATPVPSAT